MSTPIQEKEQFSFPAFAPDPQHDQHQELPPERRSSDEDGTLRGEHPFETHHDEHHRQHGQHVDDHHLRVATSFSNDPEYLRKRSQSPMSAAAQREQSRRLDDDLEMLRVERVISNEVKDDGHSMGRSMRSRGHGGGEPIDDFDINTTPIHEKTKIYRPPAHPATALAKFFKKIHGSSILVRYFVYITPLMLLLLIPVLFGLFLFDQKTVGGVKLFWFGIWLEIVWLTLWLARVSNYRFLVEY